MRSEQTYALNCLLNFVVKTVLAKDGFVRPAQAFKLTCNSMLYKEKAFNFEIIENTKS